MYSPAIRKIRDSITAICPDRDEAESVRQVFDDLLANCSAIVGELLPGQDRAANDGRRADSQTLPMFARQLEHVFTEVEREEFPELRMATGDLLPIDTSVNEGAETFKYYVYSSAGVARFIGAYSGGSLPTVTMEGAEVHGNVEPMANAYAYTTRDARNAAFTGYPLETEAAMAARRAHDQLLHKTGCWGRMDLGLPGLFNHPNINHTSPGTSAGVGDDTWPNKTQDEIIADVVSMVHGVDEVTLGQEKVNRVEISRKRYNLISTMRMGAGDGTLTVLGYLQAMFPEVTFKAIDELDGDHSDGNLDAGTHSMFAYTAGNKRKASLVVPMPFKQYPVQQKDLQFRVPCESSTGGVKMPRPLMCNRMDGI